MKQSHRVGAMIRAISLKEWTLFIKNVVKKIVKKVFKAQRSPILILFHNSGDKTIFKNLEQQFMSVIKFKPKLCTTYIKLCNNFGRRDRETDIRHKWLLRLSNNTTILKSKLLSSVT